MIHSAETPKRARAVLFLALALGAVGAAAAVVDGPATQLLASIAPPAASATAAAAQFRWTVTPDVGGTSPCASVARAWLFASIGEATSCLTATVGTGPLGTGLSAVARARAAVDSELHAVANRNTSATAAAAPPELARAMTDTAAAAAFQKKLAGMTDAQREAYAMQLAQQMQKGRQQQMTAQMQATAQASDTDRALYDSLSNAAEAVNVLQIRTQLGLQIQMGALDTVTANWESPHAAIQRAESRALKTVPLSTADNAGGGCYSAANAARVRAIALRFADRQIARADSDLAQGRGWATAVQAELPQFVKADDRMMKFSTGIHDATLRRRAASLTNTKQRTVLDDLQHYADGVRKIDEAAGVWVAWKAKIQAQPASAFTCGSGYAGG